MFGRFSQLALGVLVPCFFLSLVGATSSVSRAISESYYSRAHSLGDSYTFDPRDGWQTLNVTDLPYKYESRDIGPRSTKHQSKSKSGLSNLISDAIKGLKGIGKPEKVTITWYTGHDLQNPSCWANGNWAPTDNSFACALTLTGWANRPQCFKFLELCNSPKKCVFVRVVDTCAGCQKGAHHVDLTRAAFGQLANFETGMLSVQMRMATEPDTWHENLWGPQQKDK